MLKKNLVAFLDVLGFKAAVNDPNGQQLERIFSVLAKFAATNAEYSFEVLDKDKGHSVIYSTPAISSFSDHIVISQPYKEKGVAANGLEITLIHFQKMIAQIYSHALSNGFLLRGAITVGDLYHEKNIVFGKGLVEVATIESELARYPRIVLSDTLAHALTLGNNNYLSHGKKVDEVLGAGVIRKDFDGLYYIDWINNLKFKLDDMAQFNWPSFGARMQPLKKEIEKNLISLKSSQAHYKNWYWMANYYNISLLNLTSAHGSTPPDQEYLPKINLESF